jgi:hypothetical protein
MTLLNEVEQFLKERKGFFSIRIATKKEDVLGSVSAKFTPIGGGTLSDQEIIDIFTGLQRKFEIHRFILAKDDACCS